MMKTPKTLNHHLLSAELRDNRAREAERATANDVQKLLDLYRSSLKKPVSIDVAALFAQNYLANGQPFKLVEDAIKALASNPLLHAATMSPNAVWQLAYMKQRSARSDASIRAHIRDRRYSSEPDEQLRNSIAEFATQNGYDEAIFLAFYATLINDFFAQRIQDREDRAKWEAENRNSNVFTAPGSSGEPEPNAFPSAPAAEMSPSEPLASKGSEELPTLDTKACSDDSSSSIPSSDEAPLSTSAEKTADHPASTNKHDETSPENIDPAHRSGVFGCDRSLQDAPADIGDLGSNLVELPGELPSQSQPSRRAEAPDKPSRLDPLNTPEFLAARNKNDFARIVVQALKTVTCPEAKRSLTLFAELVAIDRMKFEELRKIVTRHSSPPKRIAA
jgi:hypothetical protein